MSLRCLRLPLPLNLVLNRPPTLLTLHFLYFTPLSFEGLAMLQLLME